MQEFAPTTYRIVGLFPELLGIGGIQEAGRLTAAALQEISLRYGCSTDFLSLNDPPGLQSLKASDRVIPFWGFRRRKIRFLISGALKVRPFVRNDAPIVLSAHPNLAVAPAWMQRVCPHLRSVVMTHGVEVWKPLGSLRRRALVSASLVLAPSSDTAKKLIDVQGIPSEKVRTLPWPLSPSFVRLADAPASLPLPHGFPQQGPIILTVARWASSERYKGTEELIRAIPQLVPTIPGLQLVAVGGGDDLPRLQRIAAILNVADRVHFLENISREEIAACYARSDLFALPSTGEGFGFVFLEAMAFSKPVVGATCGGTTDVVEEGINGFLVPPDDASALASVLGRLLRDKALCVELGRRGAEAVRRKFQFNVFQSELEKILGEINSGLAEASIHGEIL